MWRGKKKSDHPHRNSDNKPNHHHLLSLKLAFTTKTFGWLGAIVYC
jgi:hypothetical protein